jgi:type I restriction enzyme S subunit
MIQSAVSLNEAKPLPDGWRWVRLGEVCKINPSRPNGFTRLDDTPTTFVPMAAVDERLGIISKPEIRSYSEISVGYTYFEECDVLFAKITPCMQNGKHAIARNLIDDVGFGSTEFHVLRPSTVILPEWIYFFVRQPAFLREAEAYFVGAVGQQRVPEIFLANYHIPLPPLPEQKRIAARVQELVKGVEHARAACEARLEAAQALPQAYLRQVFESEEAKKWERRRLAEICEVVTGNTPSKNNPENYGDYLPWVKPEDLDKEMYVKDTTEYLSVLGARQARVLPRGAIMVSCIGNLGKIAIAGCNLATNQQINSLIPKPEVDSEYLYFCCATIQNALEKLAASTTLKIVNKTAFASITIPFPSLLEQQQIASELKDKTASAEELKADIVKQLEAIKALPQAILRKAFRGEL